MLALKAPCHHWRLRESQLPLYASVMCKGYCVATLQVSFLDDFPQSLQQLPESYFPHLLHSSVAQTVPETSSGKPQTMCSTLRSSQTHTGHLFHCETLCLYGQDERYLAGGTSEVEHQPLNVASLFESLFAYGLQQFSLTHERDIPRQ